MPDLNKEALAIWESLKPAIDKEIEKKTAGMVQRRKMKVSTAPSLSTGLIGVTEPFGDEIFIPFVGNLATATVGTPVWVEFSYGANNYIAIGYASLTDKDVTIAGMLDVVQRRCSATIPASSAGWKRIMVYNAASANNAIGSRPFTVDITLFETARQLHSIRLNGAYTKVFFDNEHSVTQNSSYNTIDGIRYTYDANNKGYIDVHYALSSSRTCQAYFDIKILDNSFGARFVPVDFTAVADSPAGETIYATYDFANNGTKYRDLLSNSFNGMGIESVDIANGATANINIPSGSIAYMMFANTASNDGDAICFARCNSSGTLYYAVFKNDNTGGGLGYAFSKSTNTFTVVNNVGYAATALILRLKA